MNDDQELPEEPLGTNSEREGMPRVERSSEPAASPSSESSRTSSSYDPPPRKKRGCIVGTLRNVLLFPFVTYRGMVGHRDMGSVGVLLFIILFPLWVYMYATPVFWWYSYNLSSEDTARVENIRGDKPAGVAYVDALIHSYEAEMSHWMVNDRVAPTILLDNPQNFQLGVKDALLYGVRVLRDNLSRQRSTDTIDPDIAKAFGSFSYDEDKWFIPSTENQYEEGIAALKRYRERLMRGEAPFHPRADNLAELITQFNSLTGGANARLLNCTPENYWRSSEETLGDPTISGEAKIKAKVPWSQVDDHFYYARGVAYVFRDVMNAVNQDFRDILEQRNAQELARSIVEDFLDEAQFEPIYVARGRSESLWANHPFKLLALLSQVRERCRSLHTMIAIDVR